MIIDAHAHLADVSVFSKSFLESIIDDFSVSNANPLLVQALMSKVLSDTDCEKLIVQMDEAGIDKTVLLMTDFGYEEDMSLDMLYQKNIKAKERYPDRIISFFGCDCRRGTKGIELFEQGVKEYGIKGLKLYPPCGFDLNDISLMPYYEICQDYAIPVLTHTGASNPNMYNDYDYIGQLEEVIGKFPKIKIIMAHLTTEGFEDRVLFCEKHRNVYGDLSAFQKEFNKDSLQKKMQIMLDRIPEQILFGTDWPLYSTAGKQKKWVDYFKNNSKMKEQDKERILGKNYQKMMEE